MKLLLQIKGESSSVIPEGLTNGRGRAPKSGRRENCGAKQPPPGVYKCPEVPSKERCRGGRALACPGWVNPSWWPIWEGRPFLGAKVSDPYETGIFGQWLSA